MNLNEATDSAIAIVQCGEEQCVNLISPTIMTCVTNTVHAVARAARVTPGITPEDIKVTIRTMLAAAKLSPKGMAQEIEIRKDMFKENKEAQKEIIPEYKATLDLLRNLDVVVVKR